ncbi:MAG: hypothetical protein V4773_23425 [Verrucomicrobiota bacterium]
MAAKSRKKTWREKLAADHDLPKVIALEAKKAARFGGATMAIPAPREVDALMRTVPKGRLTTINELRTAVAKQHRAAVGCPITTGIFAWIAAHAAEEDAAAGAKTATPYWRTLKNGGELNPKYPGGIPGVKKKLAAEGHAFVQKGQRTFVRDFEQSLHSPPAPPCSGGIAPTYAIGGHRPPLHISI